MTWYNIFITLMNCLFAFCFFYLFSRRCLVCKSIQEPYKINRVIPKSQKRHNAKTQLDRHENPESDYSLSVLRTLTCWNPPRGGHFLLIASVHLGERFLLYTINPNSTSGEIVNNLDKIAHCLLCTEDPELSEEWIRELEMTGTEFEERIMK